MCDLQIEFFGEFACYRHGVGFTWEKLAAWKLPHQRVTLFGWSKPYQVPPRITHDRCDHSDELGVALAQRTTDPPVRSSGTNLSRAGIMTAGKVSEFITASSSTNPFR